MPTVSREPSRRPELDAYRHRQLAEAFGADPERYDRARPRYPDALVQRIIDAGSGLDVLDVGCGTGIEARQLQAVGCTVLGVDADTRMAEFARRTGVEVEVARFESWDPGGRTFDLVVAGQAWHWVDPAAGAAKAAQVLRPRGRLALFWHVFDAPAEVAGAFTEAYTRVAPDNPIIGWPTSDGQQPNTAVDLYVSILDQAADGIRETGQFGEPQQWRFDWQQTYTRDQWLDHLLTTSALTQLSADQLVEVLDCVGATMDKIGGSFTMPYSTLAATAVKIEP
jgi:SAM-dependent methyltransferase